MGVHAAAAARVASYKSSRKQGDAVDPAVEEAPPNAPASRNGAGVRERLDQLRMGDREIEEAIRVTEERLATLKKVVREEKAERERQKKVKT